jgi:hypothetical protein
MKHWDNLRDAGIGCLLMIGGVIFLVKIVQFLISLIL